ncbi:MAG: hypothetical protein HYR55_18375 [Acidobacteria bacterium]|nr:hypothetical protein [Acidobacteriota bacterium]
MRKPSVCLIIMVLVGMLTIGETNVMNADDNLNSPKTKPSAANKAKKKRATPVPDAEARAQAAERRAREAEAAAAKAGSDAKAAQEQAAQALETARRAFETVARLQESLTRLEQSTGRASSDIAALKTADEQSASDMKTLRANTEAGTKKIAAVEKRTDGAMTSVSKVPVKFYGNILFNSNYLDGGANNADIPLFGVKRGTAFDQNHQSFNMTLRQTRFGVRYDSKIFSDANLTGVFEFDMLGGKPAFTNGVHFDLFRLRLAYGRIDWAKDSLEVGQDWTVFSPLNPTTLASYAIPGLVASGNLWQRLPQIRYEHRAKIGDASKFIFTGALLDPNAGDNGPFAVTRTLGLGERGTMPAIESRFGFTTPAHGKESSGGVSGHYSRLLAPTSNLPGNSNRASIDSYGVSGDWNTWLTSGVRVSGEFFHGRALGIFSGNIFQSALVDPITGRVRGLTSTGGWMEMHGEAPTGYEGPWKNFSTNFGYGTEDNRAKDFGNVAGLRKRNQTYMVNGHYKFSPNFTFALEYRHIQTDWHNQRPLNRKLNWGNMAFLYSF